MTRRDDDALSFWPIGGGWNCFGSIQCNDVALTVVCHCLVAVMIFIVVRFVRFFLSCTSRFDTIAAVTFNGVEAAGVEDGVVYATASMTFVTLSYDLFKEFPLDICGQWVAVADNTDDAYQACPDDGLYAFDVGYDLPDSGDATSWLATGWAGEAYVQIYSQPEDTGLKNLVGDCTFTLRTDVTQTPAELQTGLLRGIGFPSAFTASIMAAVVLGILALCCCYCACCRRKKETKNGFKDKLINKDAETAMDTTQPEFQARID